MNWQDFTVLKIFDVMFMCNNRAKKNAKGFPFVLASHSLSRIYKHVTSTFSLQPLLMASRFVKPPKFNNVNVSKYLKNLL